MLRKAAAALTFSLFSCGVPTLVPAPASETPHALPPVASGAASSVDPARCAKGRPDVRPFIVNWDATEQSEFASITQDSLAVVRVNGCTLEMLVSCKIPGAYVMHATAGNLQKLEIRSEDELFATLPLGVASLGAHVKRGSALSVSYFVSGTVTASAPALYRSQLGSGCEGATHLVLNFASGAYEVGFARATEAGGQASVGGVGAGAQTSGSTAALLRGGDVAACQRGARCGAPVRLRLLPIVEGAPPEGQAKVAALAITKPATGDAPRTMLSDADMAVLTKAAHRSLLQALRSCVDEFPPDWTKAKVVRLSPSMTIDAATGIPAKVEINAVGASEALVRCAEDAAMSARYPARGGKRGEAGSAQYDYVGVEQQAPN